MQRNMQPRVMMIEGWGELELIEASYDRPRFARHAHGTYAIGVVRRGVNRFRYRGEEHWAPEGTLCTVTPDEAHDVEPGAANGFAYRCMYPSLEVMQRIADSLRLSPVRRSFLLPPVIDDTPAAALVDSVFEETAGGASSLERDTALAALIARVLTRHAAEPLRPRVVNAPRRCVATAHEYLMSHYSENISLHALAEIAGVELFVLIRSFKQTYGVPPHAWLVQERVRRAQALLREGVTPAEVASTVGFADQSHLTRCFKRIVGVTPGCYQDGASRAVSARSSKQRGANGAGLRPTHSHPDVDLVRL